MLRRKIRIAVIDIAKTSKLPMDSYNAYLKHAEMRFEQQCIRCGRCCGATDGDPCVHLIREQDGRYRCAVYNDRYGLQKTAGGRVFTCVPIRNLIALGALPPECAYAHHKDGGLHENR